MKGLLQGSYVRRWEGFFWKASGRLMWLMEGFREASGRACGKSYGRFARSLWEGLWERLWEAYGRLMGGLWELMEG